MENDVKNLIGNLISDFVDETENGFCEMVYERFYAYLADSFSEAVNELCKIIVFGREYSLSVQDLYNFDRAAAVDAWNDHVGNLFGDFYDWVSEVVREDLEEFATAFQQWLANRADERASDVIVALMSGDIDITDSVARWLYDRLHGEDWGYPA